MDSDDTRLLHKILDKLSDIDKRLEAVERELIYIKDSSINMNDHISFVENVYDSIKNPFYFIMNKIKPIENIPTKETKQISN